MFLSSFFVNPLGRTLDPIYNKAISKEIININEDSPGKWVALDNLTGGNFLYALGVKSLNGVQFYPDLEFWNDLDENKEYEEIYNRYAHILVRFTTEKTSFELKGADIFEVQLDIKDIPKTGVKYIMSSTNLDEFNKSTTLFEKLYYNEIDNVYIYEYIG